MRVNLDGTFFRDSYGELNMSSVQEAVTKAMEELSSFNEDKHRILSVRVRNHSDQDTGFIRIGDE